MEFELRYPNGQTHSSRENHDLLLEKMELLEKELEVEKKAAEFQKKSLRNLRTDLSSTIGYAELGERGRRSRAISGEDSDGSFQYEIYHRLCTGRGSG